MIPRIVRITLFLQMAELTFVRAIVLSYSALQANGQCSVVC
jgi:hypothetical protein